MSSHRRRHRPQLKGIDEINMTPLIDLTFLLLIVFMITMPLMEYGTDVVAPSMNAEPLPEENVKYVDLRADGVYVVDEIEMNEDQARAELAQLHAARPDLEILVRADGSVSWNEVTELVKMIRNAGFTRAKTVTTAE